MTNHHKQSFKNSFPYLLIISLAVFTAYSRLNNASFLSWDDAEYVTKNADITNISLANLKLWFSSFYVGNYHPLTMLSYSIDYLLGGTSPLVYHITSVALHCINAILVFTIFKKIHISERIALLGAIIFALHPMHTESVSWIAERKTVLSALFFFTALLQYIKYTTRPSVKGMIIFTICGAAAMLSKGTAVALPLSLFAIDIWLHRHKSSKIITEKIPLFLLAAILGYVAILAQQSGKFMDVHTQHTITEKILYAAYAYSGYIVHFLLPIKLAAMYPYPEAIGWVQIVLAIVTLGIMGLAYWAYKNKWRYILGGIVFFTANIIFLLQLLSFGEAIMADRYLYVSCIGIIVPVLFGIQQLLKPISNQRLTILTSAVGLALLVSTFIRNEAWMSDTNFFHSLLIAYPESAVAEYSVGAMYLKNGDMPNAEIHLSKAVRLDPENYKAWYNKGTLHLRQGKAMEALEAFDKSIAINSYQKAYFSRAVLHQATGNTDLALADVEQVLKLQPNNARALCIKGDCMDRKGDTKTALEYYNKAVEIDSREPLFYIKRGIAFGKMKQYSLATGDFDVAILLQPSSGEAYYFRGMIKYQAGQSPCEDLRNALQRKYQRANEAYNSLCAKRQ